MSNSVYKVIELVGTSETSWEEAAKSAVEKASKSLKELRIAEVSELDMKIEDGKVIAEMLPKPLVDFKQETAASLNGAAITIGPPVPDR